MKAILEFNLPEEQHEHQVALDGWKWKAVVSDIADNLRSRLKHDDQLNEAVGMALFDLRQEIARNIEDRGLELYE